MIQINFELRWLLLVKTKFKSVFEFEKKGFKRGWNATLFGTKIHIYIINPHPESVCPPSYLRNKVFFSTSISYSRLYIFVCSSCSAFFSNLHNSTLLALFYAFLRFSKLLDFQNCWIFKTVRFSNFLLKKSDFWIFVKKKKIDFWSKKFRFYCFLIFLDFQNS